MNAFLRWLDGLAPAALYAVAGLAAAAENVFPPLPSDVIVAFAAFAAARGRGNLAAAFAVVLAGNLGGAMLMYAAGARYGTGPVLRRFATADVQEQRLRGWYARYGLAAIAASRMLPGVRAVVPPVAGALGVGAFRSALAMAVPSALWYGGITYVAYTAGGDFDAFAARLETGQRWVAIGALAIAAIGGAVWWYRRRARRAA
ncbi:MAG TPA: VTT domain-containing protein [Gemmatirosa sp.]